MDAKEQPNKSLLALILLFITISTLFIFIYKYSFLLETLYITINDSISRKALFLFCNVILLILAIDSGLFRSSVPSICLYDELLIRKEESRKHEADAIGKKQILDGSMHDNIDEQVALVVNEEEEEEEEEEEGYHEEEDEGMSNEGMELVLVDDQREKLEVEELNKRIEEFIEKVKKRRRLEDMQLVMVS